MGGKIAQLYIPTPETVKSSLQYEQLYPQVFAQPQTYIRFSSTVEDCTGCPFSMNSEDAGFLKALNQKRSKSGMHCSEDEFEIVMQFFEDIAQSKQPFAAVDNPPVLSFEEFETSFDETVEDNMRKFAKDIYEHWKTQRLENNNHLLMPTLKFETNLETDDSDPYVCFRRREVRQIRKTRGRDAQVTEKLKKLRKELEEARYLMTLVKDREYKHRESLALDRQIFEQRSTLKECKRNLSIKENDEDLINQKVVNPSPHQKCLRLIEDLLTAATQPTPKPKPKLDAAVTQRGIPGMGVKPALTRADGRSSDFDLISLQETTAKRDDAIQHFIDENVIKHQQWNRGYVDITWRPITPPAEQDYRSSFRSALAEPFLTPPASISSDTDGDNLGGDDEQRQQNKELPPVIVRYASPPEDTSIRRQPSFRRRIGRGGRTMIDRRGIKRKREDEERPDERMTDRFKYDQDSDEDNEIYPVDTYDSMHIKYRILTSMQRPVDRNAAEAQRRSLAAADGTKNPGGRNQSQGTITILNATVQQ